jgi:hypothetical protein
MIIIRTRHKIESTSLLDMNHRYIKGILLAPKASWEVNLYLGLWAFHREWSLGVESKQSSMIGGLYRLFAILRSCHTSSRLPCVDSLFSLICGTSHMSQISSCNSMILRARAQSIRAIGCHHLCVIHRDLLLTSPSVGCCQLVPSFVNAVGVFFCSKLLNFISCDLMEALPKLLFVVVVLISTILFSSCCCCLFFMDFPLCT